MEATCFYLYFMTILFDFGTCKQFAEHDLYADLWHDYQKYVRPTARHDLPTHVTFEFLLNMIIDLDEKNQIFSTRAWLNVSWIDDRISWKKDKHENISILHVPKKKIWKPDIVLTNKAEGFGESFVSTDYISVNYDGKVFWQLFAIFRSSCSIDIKYFPFDQQQCSLNFTPWSHSANEINFTLMSDNGFLLNNVDTNEFILKSINAEHYMSEQFSEPRRPWPMIVVKIVISRRPFFYVFNHIMPSVLTSSMALIGFLIPHDSGEKVAMYTSMMLSMSVYLKTITKFVPPTNDASIVGLFYVLSLIMVCCITVLNIWTMNLNEVGWHNNQHPPQWVRKWILGYLAYLLRVKHDIPENYEPVSTKEHITLPTTSVVHGVACTNNRSLTSQDSPTASIKSSSCEKQEFSDNSTSSSATTYSPYSSPKKSPLRKWVPYSVKYEKINETFFPLIFEMENIMKELLNNILQQLLIHDLQTEMANFRKHVIWEWKALAFVLDRFLLCIFFVVTTLTSILIFIQPAILNDH